MAARSARAPFVGRREELAALTTALQSAVDGVASAVLVTGEAGVGKTRLAAELARGAAADGATVLVGGCVELSAGEVPYAPWLEAFRRVPEAAALVERLGGGAGQAPAVPTGSVFPLVVDLLGVLSDRAPVVLVLEDLHWADRTSLELLAYLVRNLCQDRDLVGTPGGERVLLIGTARSDDLRRDDPRRATLSELARRCEQVHVGRMSRDDIAALVEGLLGAPDERLVTAVYDRSAGNCYLAEELASAGVDDPATPLPDSLRDLLLRRVTPLSAPARETVRVAAVVARPVPHALLAASCDLAEDELAGGLDEAVNATVLRYADDAYDFRHALVQEVAYHELLPGDRVRLHRAVATALTADPSSGPAELAHHWYAAGVWDRALLCALLGARRSAELSAYAEAHALYERVLDLLPRLADAGMSHVDGVRIPDRVSLLPDVADAAHWAGATGRAVELTREALAAVDGRRYPARNGALWERLGRYLWEQGDADESLAADRAAAAVLESQPASALRARVLAALGTGLMIRGDHAAALDICTGAVEMARAVGARAEEAYALCTLGVSQAMTGSLDDGLATLRTAGTLAGGQGRLEDVCRVHANLSFVLTNAGRLEESLQEAYAGIALTRTVQMERTAGGTMLVNAADTLFLLGRWEQAAALARGALSRGVAPLFAGHLLLSWAGVLLGTGRLDDAADRLARAESEGSGDATFLAELAAAKAEVALWSDDADAAARHVAVGLGADAPDPLLAARLHALGARAQADAAVKDRMLGRTEALARRQVVAAEHAAAAAALAGTALRLDHVATDPTTGDGEAPHVQPEVVAQAATAAAEAERVPLRPADAAWREAVHAWSAVGQPFRLGYVLWREAEALLAAKRRREAEATARRAARLAADLGAPQLAERVRRLAASAHLDLTAVGSDPVPEPRSSVEAVRLTAREQQVLALVTAGRTNRQIARGLGISEKTASVHVSNILGKLGAANRVEAAAAAHALNLVEGGVTSGAR